MPELREDGIYFGLPEADYHAEPRLSASLMKWLRVSPRDFWVRSWMNPTPPQEEESMPKIIGSAYHKRILEGKQAFNEKYAAELEKADYPRALFTMDDLRKELADRGLKVSGRKEDLIERVLDDNPHAPVWDRLVARHAAEHLGKILLPQATIDRIAMAAALIELHPFLSKCFSGGYPEVSVFYHDDETEVPLKSRFDYLKTFAVCDLKSFSNPFGKPIDVAVRWNISTYGYYVQASLYMKAAEIAQQFVKQGKVNGDVSPDFLKLFGDTDNSERHFVFVFQDTGPAQVARGFILPRGTVLGIGELITKECINRYADCFQRFGEGSWVDTETISTLEDTSFPAWLGMD